MEHTVYVIVEELAYELTVRDDLPLRELVPFITRLYRKQA